MDTLKKQLITGLFIITGMLSFAQVGVGTTTPTTSLDVVGANHTTAPGALASADGVSVPRVTTDMTGTPVAGTTTGQLVYSTHATSTGYYLWDGSSWEPLVPAATPAFSVGSGGILTVTLNGTNNDFSANTTNNVFQITPNVSAGFQNDVITLPTPANNVGRIILIKNVGGKGIVVGNAFNSVSEILSTRAGAFICDGVHWVNAHN